MRRSHFQLSGVALTLLVSFLVAPHGLAQFATGMRNQGPGTLPPAALPPGKTAGFGYGGGYAPYIGVFAPPYMGGYGGYDPNVASVPSAAYFTYGRTSYTTVSPSPIPVYAPPRMPYAPLPLGTPLTALIKAQVPLDAEVWLEGHKMRSGGALRHYRSPPLDPAKGYVYEVRARWLVDGKPVEDLRQIAIRAGATIVVDFTHLNPLIPRPSLPPEAPQKPTKDNDTATTLDNPDKPAR
jgi:uncharacterized protein (TIGR03000 family)